MPRQYDRELTADGWLVGDPPAPPGGGGASELDALTDVVLTAPTLGQALKFDGDNWVNDEDDGTGGPIAIADVTGLQDELDGKLSASNADDVAAGTEIAEDDEVLWYDTSDSGTPKAGAVSILRTRLANIPTGSALGTSGSVALDFATRVGTRPPITLTGNITFTTSNLAAGRHLELRITGGGSSYTITWPAFKAFGAALPTTLAAGKVLIVSLLANSTTDASVDAVAVLDV